MCTHIHEIHAVLRRLRLKDAVIRMNTHTHTHTHTHIYIYIYIYIYINTHTHIHDPRALDNVHFSKAITFQTSFAGHEMSIYMYVYRHAYIPCIYLQTHYNLTCS
jgi:hypothetical protein